MGLDHFPPSSKMYKVLSLLLVVLCCQYACAYDNRWGPRSYDFPDDMWMNPGFGYYPTPRNYYFNNDYQFSPEARKQHFYRDMWMNPRSQFYPESRNNYFHDDMHSNFDCQSCPGSQGRQHYDNSRSYPKSSRNTNNHDDMHFNFDCQSCPGSQGRHFYDNMRSYPKSRNYFYDNDMGANFGCRSHPSSRQHFYVDMCFNSDCQSYPGSRNHYFYDDMFMNPRFGPFPAWRRQHYEPNMHSNCGSESCSPMQPFRQQF